MGARSIFVSFSGTLVSVLEKLLSQRTESEHAGCLVICAALNNAAKIRELLQKYPDKASLEDKKKKKSCSSFISNSLKHCRKIL